MLKEAKRCYDNDIAANSLDSAGAAAFGPDFNCSPKEYLGALPQATRPEIRAACARIVKEGRNL